MIYLSVLLFCVSAILNTSIDLVLNHVAEPYRYILANAIKVLAIFCSILSIVTYRETINLFADIAILYLIRIASEAFARRFLFPFLIKKCRKMRF